MMPLFLLFLILLSAAAVLSLKSPGFGPPPGLDIVKTVDMPDGRVIDWVRPESQSPDFTPSKRNASAESAALVRRFVPPVPDHLRGPQGSVPIVRRHPVAFPDKKPPPAMPRPNPTPSQAAGSGANLNQTESDSASQRRVETRSHSGLHWYALVAEWAQATGGWAIFSMYNPYVETWRDFSGIQLSVTRWEAQTSKYGVIVQTLEAGYVHYPMRNEKPMFFTFFNANGYSGVGDYVCAWNREYAGWVQVDDTIFPGLVFTQESVSGGDQYEMDIEYRLEDGKWWLRALGRDVGYYPASLFYEEGVDAVDDTLGGRSDRLDYFGEVYNSGDELTTTDMGSGEFPAAGWQRAAYIKDMQWRDTDNTWHEFEDSYERVSDSSRYAIEKYWHSDSKWKSYLLVGGPGADGVVGG